MPPIDRRGWRARLPPWVVDGALGLVVVLVGFGGLNYGWRAVVGLLTPVFDIGPRTGFGVESLPAFVATLVLVVSIFGGGSLGLTYGYLRTRGTEPGFVVRSPDRLAARWLLGLVGFALLLVGGAALVWRAGYRADPGSGLRVPSAIVGAPGAPMPAYVGEPNTVVLVLGTVVVTSSLGIAVGSLLHGVFQQSIRQSVATAPAVAVTALALVVLFGHTSAPTAVGVLVAFGALVGYAYDRTGNLLVPVVAYAVFNTVVLAATSALFRLAVAGRL